MSKLHPIEAIPEGPHSDRAEMLRRGEGEEAEWQFLLGPVGLGGGPDRSIYLDKGEEGIVSWGPDQQSPGSALTPSALPSRVW